MALRPHSAQGIQSIRLRRVHSPHAENYPAHWRIEKFFPRSAFSPQQTHSGLEIVGREPTSLITIRKLEVHRSKLEDTKATHIPKQDIGVDDPTIRTATKEEKPSRVQSAMTIYRSPSARTKKATDEETGCEYASPVCFPSAEHKIWTGYSSGRANESTTIKDDSQIIPLRSSMKRPPTSSSKKHIKVPADRRVLFHRMESPIIQEKSAEYFKEHVKDILFRKLNTLSSEKSEISLFGRKVDLGKGGGKPKHRSEYKRIAGMRVHTDGSSQSIRIGGTKDKVQRHRTLPDQPKGKATHQPKQQKWVDIDSWHALPREISGYKGYLLGPSGIRSFGGT